MTTQELVAAREKVQARLQMEKNDKDWQKAAASTLELDDLNARVAVAERADAAAERQRLEEAAMFKRRKEEADLNERISALEADYQTWLTDVTAVNEAAGALWPRRDEMGGRFARLARERDRLYPSQGIVDGRYNGVLVPDFGRYGSGNATIADIVAGRGFLVNKVH